MSNATDKLAQFIKNKTGKDSETAHREAVRIAERAERKKANQ